MSEKILRALMRLFAIIAASETEESNKGKQPFYLPVLFMKAVFILDCSNNPAFRSR